MAKREKIVVPKRFVYKYGENIHLWSFSKVSTFENCPHEYFLSRIKKYKSEDNIYTLLGTYSHDVLEAFYNGEIKYEEMAQRFETSFLDVEMSDYKFNNDEDKNKAMRDKYKKCVVHFFNHHVPEKSKVLTEKCIWIDLDGNLFIGYMDAIHKDDEGCYVITDFKTSTKFTKKDIYNKSKQLLLYALGLHQGGVPLNKIKIRFNFLKYAVITYKQKNGKYKDTVAERHKWVQAIKTPLKKDLKEFYEMEDWQADLKIDELIKENSLESIDKSIQEKYSMSDYYLYVDVTEDIIEQLKQDMTNSINEIKKRGEDESNWTRDEIQKNEEYYCSVLCGVKGYCKYYKEHLNQLGIASKTENDIISELDELDDLPPWDE